MNINYMTMHSSKGLECDDIIIINLNLIPPFFINYSLTYSRMITII